MEALGNYGGEILPLRDEDTLHIPGPLAIDGQTDAKGATFTALSMPGSYTLPPRDGQAAFGGPLRFAPGIICYFEDSELALDVFSATWLEAENRFSLDRNGDWKFRVFLDTGDATVRGDLNVGGDLTAEQDATVAENLTVVKDASVGESVFVDDGVVIGQTLDITPTPGDIINDGVIRHEPWESDTTRVFQSVALGDVYKEEFVSPNASPTPTPAQWVLSGTGEPKFTVNLDTGDISMAGTMAGMNNLTLETLAVNDYANIHGLKVGNLYEGDAEDDDIRLDGTLHQSRGGIRAFEFSEDGDDAFIEFWDENTDRLSYRHNSFNGLRLDLKWGSLLATSGFYSDIATLTAGEYAFIGDNAGGYPSIGIGIGGGGIGGGALTAVPDGISLYVRPSASGLGVDSNATIVSDNSGNNYMQILSGAGAADGSGLTLTAEAGAAYGQTNGSWSIAAAQGGAAYGPEFSLSYTTDSSPTEQMLVFDSDGDATFSNDATVDGTITAGVTAVAPTVKLNQVYALGRGVFGEIFWGSGTGNLYWTDEFGVDHDLTAGSSVVDGWTVSGSDVETTLNVKAPSAVFAAPTPGITPTPADGSVYVENTLTVGDGLVAIDGDATTGSALFGGDAYGAGLLVDWNNGYVAYFGPLYFTSTGYSRRFMTNGGEYYNSSSNNTLSLTSNYSGTPTPVWSVDLDTGDTEITGDFTMAADREILQPADSTGIGPFRMSCLGARISGSASLNIPNGTYQYTGNDNLWCVVNLPSESFGGAVVLDSLTLHGITGGNGAYIDEVILYNMETSGAVQIVTYSTDIGNGTTGMYEQDLLSGDLDLSTIEGTLLLKVTAVSGGAIWAVNALIAQGHYE